MSRSAAAPSEEVVWAELATIPDPEIPAISVVDLGVIGSVKVDDEAIRVELLPTFVGCPAIGVMQQQIGERLASLQMGRVEVEVRQGGGHSVPSATARAFAASSLCLMM